MMVVASFQSRIFLFLSVVTLLATCAAGQQSSTAVPIDGVLPAETRGAECDVSDGTCHAKRATLPPPVDATYPWVNKVHVVYMTHLDIGYTNLARNVCELYFFHHFPNAIATAQQVRAEKGKEKFVYTTHPWLLLEFLDGKAGCTPTRPTAKQLKAVEDAIARGDISWHANAFSMFMPLLDESLFRYSLTLAHQLDDRFNKTRKFGASQKDTMGSSISAVPLFRKEGVRSLHVGANSACKAPDVPPAFVWKHEESGTDLITMMYNKKTAVTPCTSTLSNCFYSGDVCIPGVPEALVYSFQLDNQSPQTPADVSKLWADIAVAYPNAEIVASSLDDFTLILEKFKSFLPVITDEIGDSWTYGSGGDPFKLAAFRELSRFRNELLETEGDSDELDAYSRRLLKNPEHNWGLSVSTYFESPHYSGFWSNDEFATIRSSPDVQLIESGWKEARSFLYPQSSRLLAKVKSRLADITPSRPDMSKYVELDPLPGLTMDTKNFNIGFDTGTPDGAPGTGAINSLISRWTPTVGKVLADPGNTLATLLYQTFSMDDFDRFNTQYNPGCGPPCGDFSKPGMGSATPQSADWQPIYQKLWGIPEEDKFLMLVTFPQDAQTRYGAPKEVYVSYDLSVMVNNRPAINMTVQWFGKKATRLAEATWFQFYPMTEAPASGNVCDKWTIDVQGSDIVPSRVAEFGTRHLHATWDGVRYNDPDSPFYLRSLDAPLVSPGVTDHLLNFDNTPADCQRGMNFNLHNNLWGTAFPQWYEDDALWRFTMVF